MVPTAENYQNSKVKWMQNSLSIHKYNKWQSELLSNCKKEVSKRVRSKDNKLQKEKKNWLLDDVKTNHLKNPGLWVWSGPERQYVVVCSGKKPSSTPTKQPLQLRAMPQSPKARGQEWQGDESTHLSYLTTSDDYYSPCTDSYSPPCSRAEEGNRVIVPLVAYTAGQKALCEKILYKASCVSAYMEY